MLNSVGLQNPGWTPSSPGTAPSGRRDIAVIANVAGATVEEYWEIARRLEGTAVDMIEVNISCPNVKEGGAAFGTSCQVAATMVSGMRARTKKPLMVKLSPNVTDITAIARSVEDAGADAVSIINTLSGMRIDIRTRRPVLHNNAGGLSGPAVLPGGSADGLAGAARR